MDGAVAGQLREERHDAGVGVGQRLAGAVDVLQPEDRQPYVVRARPTRPGCAPGPAWWRRRRSIGAGSVPSARSSARARLSGKSHCAAPRAGRACAGPGWYDVPSASPPRALAVDGAAAASARRAGARAGRGRASSSWVVPTTLTARDGCLASATGRCRSRRPGARRRRAARRPAARPRSPASVTSPTTSSAARCRRPGGSRAGVHLRVQVVERRPRSADREASSGERAADEAGSAGDQDRAELCHPALLRRASSPPRGTEAGQSLAGPSGHHGEDCREAPVGCAGWTDGPRRHRPDEPRDRLDRHSGLQRERYLRESLASPSRRRGPRTRSW